MGKALQVIFVDRKDPDSRHLSLARIRNRGKSAPGTFPPLAVFPEGTCTNGRVLIQFKKGAFDPGCAVLPVCLSYSHNHINPAATGSVRGVLFKCMFQFGNRLTVTELPPMAPAEGESAETFGARVRDAMAVALDVGCTEHSYADFFLKHAADRAHVPQTFEVAEFTKLYRVKGPELELLLARFQEADVDRSGTLDYDEFCEALDLRPDTAAQSVALFSFFDKHDTGQIDFAAFTYGLALLSPECTDVDRRRLVFAIYDRSGDGYVRWQDMKKVITLMASAAGPGSTRSVSISTASGAAGGSGGSDDDEEAPPVTAPGLMRRASCQERAKALGSAVDVAEALFETLAGDDGRLDFDGFQQLLDRAREESGVADLIERVPLDWAEARAAISLEEVRTKVTSESKK